MANAHLQCSQHRHKLHNINRNALPLAPRVATLPMFFKCPTRTLLLQYLLLSHSRITLTPLATHQAAINGSCSSASCLCITG